MKYNEVNHLSEAPAAKTAIAPAAPKQYANKLQLDAVIKRLQSLLPDGTFKYQAAGGTKPVPHIRAQRISNAELKTAMSKISPSGKGAEVDFPDEKQKLLSGKYSVQSFLIDGIAVSIVIGAAKMGSEDSVGINRKELTPTNLGLTGRPFSRKELIVATKAALPTKVRDEQLRAALDILVDIAANRGKGTLPPELAAHIAPVVGVIAQDFGEILAPIILMDDSDMADFPAGNYPLVDVRLKTMNISVKALSGSGTSFTTVKHLMDKYESNIDPNDIKRKKLFNVLKEFRKEEGLAVDKIVKSTALAKTAEYIALNNLLGVDKIMDYKHLKSLCATKFAKSDYVKFLKAVYPVMTAGNWGIPMGLPADGDYYLGNKASAPEKTKSAGKVSYDVDHAKGSANILTYMLGKGLERYILKGKQAAQYSIMMTDIVKEADAVLGHITINRDGSMEVVTKPFSELKFKFDYHAPSHMPGNNLPGFIYIP
jgi:hypothetical protein